MGRREWRYAMRRAWHGFLRHRGLDSAAALTFFAALTMFPAALVLVSVFAIAEGRTTATEDVLAVIGEFTQPSTVDALRDPLQQLVHIPNPAIALLIGLASTLWTASAYATAFGRAMNAVYEVQEGRHIWRFRGLMLLVTVVLIVGFALLVTLLLLTPSIAAAIAAAAGFGEPWITLFNVLKWVVIAGVAFTLVAMLYYFTPNVKHTRKRWVSYGSAFAVLVWALGTVGFAVYIFTVGQYERVYGWLGGGVVTLLWLYLTNVVMVLGAEVDAEIVRARQLLAGIQSEDVIRLPARDTARTLMLARQRSADVTEGREIRESAAE